MTGRSPLAQLGVELEQRLVDERALLERVELFERRRLLTGRELVDRLEHEAVRARGVVLQPRRRVRPRGELVPRERCQGLRPRMDQAVGRGPPAKPPPAAGPQGALQVRVRGQEVAGHADRLGLGPAQYAFEQREVVLGEVDGVPRVGGRRPPDLGGARDVRASRQLVEARQLSLGGAQHLEPVERWSPGPGLLEVESRIRDDDAPRGGADGDAEREPLGRRAVLVRGQPASSCARGRAGWGLRSLSGERASPRAPGRTRRRTRDRAPPPWAPRRLARSVARRDAR